MVSKTISWLSTLCSTAGAIRTATHRRFVDVSSRTNDAIPKGLQTKPSIGRFDLRPSQLLGPAEPNRYRAGFSVGPVRKNNSFGRRQPKLFRNVRIIRNPTRSSQPVRWSRLGQYLRQGLIPASLRRSFGLFRAVFSVATFPDRSARGNWVLAALGYSRPSPTGPPDRLRLMGVGC